MIVSHFWHSFIGHPLMALFHSAGLYSLGNDVHDRLFVEPPANGALRTMTLDDVIAAVEAAKPDLWWTLDYGWYTDDPPGYAARVWVCEDAPDPTEARAEAATPADALRTAAEALLGRPLTTTGA